MGATERSYGMLQPAIQFKQWLLFVDKISNIQLGQLFLLSCKLVVKEIVKIMNVTV